MIQNVFESRVKIQQIIDNQLPEFIKTESPKALDFLKQYYISQEYQGGPVDIVNNLDQYLSLDSLIPEVIVDNSNLSVDITADDKTIQVSSTKGFPDEYGLLKIDDEIITYTGITTNSFIGCKRGFSGITGYHQDLNREELIFSDSIAASHSSGSSVQNLSSLFLKEFYQKLKFSLVPGLEDVDFTPTLNVGNFLKESRALYQSKGTNESFRILFGILYNETPSIINLEDYLIKSSAAQYVRREVVIGEIVNENSPDGEPPNPKNLIGQTLYKTSDLNTNAAISEVEPFTRIGVAVTASQQYYKISLFIGYDDSASTVQGNFNITPATKVIGDVGVGSSVIAVDSTIGFRASGSVVSGDNNISYTDKSINQFFGCSGINKPISSTDNIRSNEDTYFGYESGDTTRKVEFRLTGVLSEFEQVSEDVTVDEGEIIGVRNLGELIKNPSENKTYKEILANSLIYNTSTRYQIQNPIDDNILTLNAATYDRSSLKEGDAVEILGRGSNDIIFGKNELCYIKQTFDNNEIKLSADIPDNLIKSDREYDLRRKINTPISTKTPLEYDNITSDVQNLYVEEENELVYIASNSLPSHRLDKNFDKLKDIQNKFIKYLSGIDIEIKSATIPDDHTSAYGLWDEISDSLTNQYASIRFSDIVPFIDGDEVYYKPSGDPYGGLTEGTYFVEVDSTDNQKIKLYSSPTFIGSSDYLRIQDSPGNHTFTLNSQKSGKIGAQKLLKKFPLNVDSIKSKESITTPGTTGMLVNGVEITNYKSKDKVYYGNLESVSVLNSGTNYDVINLPEIDVATGFGVTALIQPVIQGSIKKVFVDTQNFDIKDVISVNVKGGNGNAIIEPIVNVRYRDVSFSGLSTSDFGGVSQEFDTIKFDTDHAFYKGQEVIYNSNGSPGVGVGIGTSTLSNGASYFVDIINEKTIKLHSSFNDAVTQTNPIDLNTINALGRDHKFSTLSNQKYVAGLNLIDGGTFTNRKLIVKPVGISTHYDKIIFDNHGFDDGDKIVYSTTGTKISGLTTSTGISTTTNQYQIIKLDDNSFRLSDAGIGGSITSNYTRGNYVRFESVGGGYHNFSYPDISISLTYAPIGIGTDTRNIEEILVTPIVRGSIIDAYLYETGTGYGSSIINFENNPIISIKSGKNASLKPNIINGKIDSVSVSFSGNEYVSIPDLNVIDSSGYGTGAELLPIIVNGRITDVKVINAGIGYSSIDTSINVVAAGKNAIIDSKVRKLDVNNNFRYAKKSFGATEGTIKYTDVGQLLLESNNNLQYSICGYNQTLRDYFGDTATEITNIHSPIIGWAYDGNPIYGSFGYKDPKEQLNNQRLITGYELDSSNIVDRPNTNVFPLGYFIDDYKFTDNGDLDRNNGRFTKTPEFPAGVYAYFATIDNENNPTFPYFIGDSYRSTPIQQDIDQSFDFTKSKLLRNTFPYKVSEKYIDNDFIIETDEIAKQKSIVDSVTIGSVDELSIVSSGDNYQIDNLLEFDDDGTEGNGLTARVSSLKGKDIVDINIDSTVINDVIFTWDDGNRIKGSILPYHSLKDKDNITISGFASTLSELNGNYPIGVTTFSASGIGTILASSGITTEIYVSSIPESVSIGSSIGIGTETLKVLDIYRNLKILRVERGLTGIAHTIPFKISYLPDSFIINKSINSFDSKLNNKVYFNPKESIGFGTISGISSSVTFGFGISDSIVRNIPTQRIYIEKHPFTEGQEVVFTAGTSNIAISTDGTDPTFSLPSTVYISNTSNNTIGIRTGIGTDLNGSSYSDVFFVSGGANEDNTYSFESKYNQLFGNIQKNVATVSVSTSHSLQVDDEISLNIKPNLSVGIDTTSIVNIRRDEITGFSLLDSIEFNSTGINTSTSQLEIISHGLKTGDKISYTTTEPNIIPEGLSIRDYFVYKVDNNKFKLSETLNDAISNPPVTVGIASTGGISQSISLINPQINVVRNNSLVFDLTHSSLQDYKLKLYYDVDFKNEFVSTASTIFDLISEGTPGIGDTATFTIDYNPSLPNQLYYTFEKSGFISTSDINVKNYSEIKFVDSGYNDTYNIIGTGTTTFDIALKSLPERLSYNQSDCDSLLYSTNSLTEKGGIDKVSIDYGGFGYKKLPNFVGTSSTEGTGALIISKSKDIGNVNQVRIVNEGFEYSSDNTLKPNASISPFITIKESNTIGNIFVTSGGRGYLNEPTINIVDSVTKKVLDKGIFSLDLIGNSINRVDILSNPYGLSDNPVNLFTTNNSNGVGIKTVLSNSSGIFTCAITTPPAGFTNPPFSPGDEAFVEGITKNSITGSGFNSKDYGFEFFKVLSCDDTGLDFKVVFDITNLTTNTGIADTINSLASVVNKENYPIFESTLKSTRFIIGEQLLIDGELRDLYITKSESDFIKIFGNYNLLIGDIIIGKESGVIATIDSITSNNGKFIVDYSNKKNIGWYDNVGKLSEDTQVTPDNDYYQNLSYSVKSSRTYDELRSTVNNLLHTSGLKNFADTRIKSTSNVGIGSADATISIRDYIGDNRVDTIYNFDIANSINSNNNSKFISLQNKKLSNYIESTSNEVLKIDNINSQFSNLDSEPHEYLNIFENPVLDYQNLVIRVSDLVNSKVQLSDLVLLQKNNNRFLLEKGQLYSGITTSYGDSSSLGSFDLIEDDLGDHYFRFTPLESPESTDYDIKIIDSRFIFTPATGTYPIGFINLSGTVAIGGIDDGIPTTTGIVTSHSEKVTSLYAKNYLINRTTKEVNYVEVYVTHDGSNTYISEYFIDDLQQEGYSSIGIGSFKGSISGTEFTLNYENNTEDIIDIKSNIVGFGTTSVGTGTHRFKLPNQPDGQERTAIYQSNYSKSIGISTVFELSKSLFNSVKSVIEVSVGSTKALHQVMVVHNSDGVCMNQLPFLSASGTIANTSIEEYDNILGIGTFGVNFDSSNNFLLKFYPDSSFNSSNIQVSALNLCIYNDIDVSNTLNTPDLSYGNIVESVDLYAYNAPYGSRVQKTEFTLTNNNIPIFAKSFDPSDSTEVNLSTGLFTIDNHFFRTNEELVYTPASTFVGVGATAMEYKGSGGIGELPTTVFAVRNNENSFYISTTSPASVGTAVTFVDVGGGNYHKFAMAKSNTKAMVSIDNILQSPVANTLLSYTLKDNVGGQIGTASTIFGLSGISSITFNDILKINDEYLKVVNVGFGTTTIGPITTGIGTTALVVTERGFVGTSATNHTDGSTVQLYRGSYNIVDEKIHFVHPPRGRSGGLRNSSNLLEPKSDFNGRVYLRNDYSTNQVYDDISEQFTGIGQTFNLTVGGANTTGLGNSGGNGLLLINNLYQRPTAENNPGNNYQIIEDTVSGISSISFTGITTDTGDIFISHSDVNQNEVPRGGLIVSLGSTPGLGYAPLVGARTFAKTNANGEITSIVSTGATGPSNSITTANYDNVTGDIIITTKDPHDFELGIVNQFKLHNLEFDCSGQYVGVTTTFFPEDIDTVTGVSSVSYSVLDTIPGDFEHKFVRDVYEGSTGAIQLMGSPFGDRKVTSAVYSPTKGTLIVTHDGASLSHNQAIKFRNGSLVFTCDADSHTTEHPYPRTTDPVYGTTIYIYDVSGNTFTVFVGKSPTYRFKTNVGISTIPHNYMRGGTVMPWYDANYGSGYRGSVSIGITDVPFTHKFVGTSGTSIFVNSWAGTPKTVTNASYEPSSGDLILTIPSHGLTTSDNVGINTDSLIFSCSKDDYKSIHVYPRSTDPVSGILTSINSKTDDTFTVNVGSSIGRNGNITATVGAGGTLAFNIGAAGTNYKNPEITVPEPNYTNLEVKGVSRLGSGTTTDTGIGLLLDVTIGASSTTGTGATQFSVTDWNITRNGYSFKKGDVFTPVGLVTDASLESPISQFELTVVDTFTDSFAAWQFGQFDYIDSIKDQQDGKRTRFNLKYDDEFLNFDKALNSDFNINLSNALLIIINGIIQEPDVSYKFNGGTSFVFTNAPKPEDNISIFFYRGTSESDTQLKEGIRPSLKSGDKLELLRIHDNDVNQKSRVMLGIATIGSGYVETDLYSGDGVNDLDKTLKWTKQKSDRIIDGESVSKSRPSLEPLIFPTAKIIGDISSTDSLTNIFIDNKGIFDDEEEISIKPIGGFIIDSISPVAAGLTAIVSAAGTISALSIVSGGSGYIGATTSVSIGIPTTGIGVGIGTTATATATITNGSITTPITITNEGFGYNQSKVPNVLASLPMSNKLEEVSKINAIQGFTGIITGISTASGIDGASLALEFNLKDGGTYNNLVVNYPIYIHGTSIGSGVTSIYISDDNIVGIGTTFLDNVYNVSAWNSTTGIITCNISSNTSVVGLGSTSGTVYAGEVSWGRLYNNDTGNITRGVNPISIGVTGLTIDAGLTTFPTIQRRLQGLRDTGGIEPS